MESLELGVEVGVHSTTTGTYAVPPYQYMNASHPFRFVQGIHKETESGDITDTRQLLPCNAMRAWMVARPAQVMCKLQSAEHQCAQSLDSMMRRCTCRRLAGRAVSRHHIDDATPCPLRGHACMWLWLDVC